MDLKWTKYGRSHDLITTARDVIASFERYTTYWKLPQIPMPIIENTVYLSFSAMFF